MPAQQHRRPPTWRLPPCSRPRGTTTPRASAWCACGRRTASCCPAAWPCRAAGCAAARRACAGFAQGRRGEAPPGSSSSSSLPAGRWAGSADASGAPAGLVDERLQELGQLGLGGRRLGALGNIICQLHLLRGQARTRTGGDNGRSEVGSRVRQAMHAPRQRMHRQRGQTRQSCARLEEAVVGEQRTLVKRGAAHKRCAVALAAAPAGLLVRCGWAAGRGRRREGHAWASGSGGDTAAAREGRPVRADKRTLDALQAAGALLAAGAAVLGCLLPAHLARALLAGRRSCIARRCRTRAATG